MISLFAHRTWYQLRAVAKAQRLPFNSEWNRQQAFERLHTALTVDGGLKRSLKTLTTRERRALQTLQAAGGGMKRAQFTRHFGTIRVCRQRHPQSVQADWRAPASVAEKLWLAGMVEIVPGAPAQLVLTEEIAALLPPLPRPQRLMAVLPPNATPHGWTRSGLSRDLAVWLGGLLARDVRPLHGRWLPPTTVRALNALLPRPEAWTGARSELGVGRLRFLHYLAEASGWLAVQNGFLKPTAAAWRWLELPASEAWAALWAALQADRAAGAVLWRRYQLPDLPAVAWDALVQLLGTMPAGSSYPIASLIAAVLPYVPPDPQRLDRGDAAVAAAIRALFDTIFAWLGWTYRADEVLVLPEEIDDGRQMPSPLRVTADALVIALVDQPPLRPLTDLLAVATVESWTLVIDAASLRRAVGHGLSALGLAETLAALCGKLPEAVLDRLQYWERAAKGLRLSPMLVLSADDPAALDALCADRGLRALIDRPLSAHHLAVRADAAQTLVKRLERRGQAVAHALPTRSGEREAVAVDEYAYFAMRVVQGLADFLPLPLTVPAAARDAVAPPVGREALDAAAARVLAALSDALQGRVSASPVEAAAPDEVRTALQQAYQAETAVTIDYFSPARGAITTREIAPLRWIERGGATYVEAWCALEGDTRTFRLDRVLRTR